ncbi:hypothetical protein EDB92DRAFT_1948053 [Lactarius akahatsu]|uniref:Uncharacterized protein n=1 Tax=Lactarius akahatsu TaxID=416441 RepID=A0AAD4LE28_9AGAM|nr:hypothetical protein EDB92DRAFT_1948053 [Lactarius akahatsu]
MSSLVPPTQLPPPSPPGLEQSQASVLGPGIAGVQGIETWLVLAQFSQWFSIPQHSESSVLSTVVIFALNPFLEKALLETFMDLMSVLLPSVLDLILTGFCVICDLLVTLASRAHPSRQVLHYLTRTMKRVYAAHKRKRIFRLANIVWQSALYSASNSRPRDKYAPISAPA